MKKKLKLNLVTSLLLQVITLICGFVLPGLILNAFGSIYNGIVNSVNQFLSCVTLLRAGIGGATRAALYKPLTENDDRKISEIINATEKFMRKIAIIFTLCLIVFASIYPFFVRNEFEWFFAFSLVIILGISTIAQYYFGITYQFLLQSDQKQYIYNVMQIFATIFNTVIAVILIKTGFDIRIVKLGSAISFGLVPIALFYYVKRNYNIDKSVEPEKNILQQRWDAFAHQISSFVHSNTDIMVLTIFSNLYNVSIYAVYNMVASGIKQLICTCSNSIEALIGSVIAKKDIEKLKKYVSVYEWWINNLSLIFLGCTAILITPFIMIYTSGVNDANYNQPLFAYLLCFATFLSCIRLPYQNVVEAAGHFKQTKKGAIIEALINIIVSIIFVYNFGCIGVAIGTIVAMIYRTIDYGVYASKNIINRGTHIFYKRMLISCIIFTLIIVVTTFFDLNIIMVNNVTNYFTWIISGGVSFLLLSIIVIIFNLLFFFDESKKNLAILLKRK